MSSILIANTPQVFNGLGTLTYTIPSTGNYNVALQCLETPVSGLSIVVNKNGSPIFTAPVITPTQSALQFKVAFQATAADVITVVLASSTLQDQLKNTVKTSVSIGLGS